MALFQPTNCIPSSYTGVTTVDANDTIEISWQVNGNSAMTAFQIDFYLNDANSTLVASTGKLPKQGETQAQYGLPFYGTDRFGRPQFFTWSPEKTWSSWSLNQLTNGNEYKYKITQFWNEGSTEKSLQQTAFSVFKTKATPTLTIYQTDKTYQNRILLPNTLATSIGYFQSQYIQAQGDPIRWIRWQVATANNGAVGTIIADTGDIYTPTLNYEFNGFFNGQQYAIRAIGESESGQATVLQGADDNGWIYFNINATSQEPYVRNFEAKNLCRENATLLTWNIPPVISPTIVPDPGYNIAQGGFGTLPENTTITWDKIGTSIANENMNFKEPWTLVYMENTPQILRQKNYKDLYYYGENHCSIKDMAIPQNNNLIAIASASGDWWNYSQYDTGLVQLGTVVDGTVTLINSQLLASISAACYAIAFSPNGNLLVVGHANGLSTFKVIGSNIEEGQTIEIDAIVTSIAFSPNGNIMVVGCCSKVSNNRGFANVYAVDNQQISETGNLNLSQTAAVSDVSFSHDGAFLLVGYNGRKDGTYATAYRVANNNNITFLHDISGNQDRDFNVRAIAFSSHENLAVITGDIGYVATMFSFNNSGFTYLFHIEKNGQPLDRPVGDASFSPDLSILALNDGRETMIFDVSETEATWVMDIGTLINNRSMGAVAKFSNGGDLFTSYASSTYQGIAQWAIPPKETLLKASPSIALQRLLDTYLLQIHDGDIIHTFSAPAKGSQTAVIAISPQEAHFYYFERSTSSSSEEWILLDSKTFSLEFTQNAVTSVSVMSGEFPRTILCVSVIKGDGNALVTEYDNGNLVKPTWGSKDYDLYMTANFNGNIEGGETKLQGDAFRIYRQELRKNALTSIATLSYGVSSLKDYGITSRKAYKYFLYAYDSNDAFMAAEETQPIATCFKSYSLLVCDYDETNDEYHVRKQYLFALNLSTDSVGNNNSPTLNANFTRYPTRMPSTQNYASGTLSGLIGAIYTVPALIEQLGNYKWTAKPSTMDYFDNVDLEKELYDLSTAPYQLFLRDMKGRLRMIHTSAPITMTTNIKPKQQPISISVPWVEVGDASDVTIIQTPDDYGWNNDNQVLDVQLDVDVATGELSATYPFPYNGTKFYLTGVNKETLTAKTPLGVTPAQFELSETATGYNDGEVTATVKVNSEDK